MFVSDRVYGRKLDDFFPFVKYVGLCGTHIKNTLNFKSSTFVPVYRPLMVDGLHR